MTNSGVDELLTAQIPPKPQDFRLSAGNHGISCQGRIQHTGAASMISTASSEIKEASKSMRFGMAFANLEDQFAWRFHEKLYQAIFSKHIRCRYVCF